MPAKVVVDASALAALLFGEPEAQIVAERLGESALITPTLFSYELANICWKKVRRHPEQRAKLLEAYSLRDRLEIEEVGVVISEVLLLADRENLTAYDASYLWLSQKLGLELVTLDRDINAVIARDHAAHS
jgi:predicted nucleic acid-binding protein